MKPCRLKNIKTGDVFTETDYGITVTLQAQEDGRFVDKPCFTGWECQTKVLKGEAGMADERGNLRISESEKCHLDLAWVKRANPE